MKKTLALLAITAFLAVGFSSCKQLNCKCTATGYASDEYLNEVLERHINDCVEIADSGETIYDSGIAVTCEY